MVDKFMKQGIERPDDTYEIHRRFEFLGPVFEKLFQAFIAPLPNKPK